MWESQGSLAYLVFWKVALEFVMVQAFNYSAQEAKARGLQLQG